MKLKVSEALSGSEALARLANICLPAVTAFKVARLASALKQPLTDYETARVALLRQVGHPDPENEENFKITDQERWVRELQALLDQEVEVPDTQFSPEDFKGANIEPKLLLQLGWCVVL